MSSPNLSKEPGDGSAQPSNPYGSPAPGATGAPSYDSAPPQGAPYQGQFTPTGAGGYPYSAPAATNSMALGSLIASIAGWTVVPFLGWIVGVVLGHIARGQLRNSNEQGAGMALAGLITGYVGIALSVLAVILLVVVFTAAGVGSSDW